MLIADDVAFHLCVSQITSQLATLPSRVRSFYQLSVGFQTNISVVWSLENHRSRRSRDEDVGKWDQWTGGWSGFIFSCLLLALTVCVDGFGQIEIVWLSLDFTVLCFEELNRLCHQNHSTFRDCEVRSWKTRISKLKLQLNLKMSLLLSHRIEVHQRRHLKSSCFWTKTIRSKFERVRRVSRLTRREMPLPLTSRIWGFPILSFQCSFEATERLLSATLAKIIRKSALTDANDLNSLLSRRKLSTSGNFFLCQQNRHVLKNVGYRVIVLKKSWFTFSYED